MTAEAEAVAREYMIYRMCEHGWGLFRILDEEGIGHGDVLTEREVVSLLAGHWERNLRADRPAVATPAPVMRQAVPARAPAKAPKPLPAKPEAVRPFRMLSSHTMQGDQAA